MKAGAIRNGIARSAPQNTSGSGLPERCSPTAPLKTGTTAPVPAPTIAVYQPDQDPLMLTGPLERNFPVLCLTSGSAFQTLSTDQQAKIAHRTARPRPIW